MMEKLAGSSGLDPTVMLLSCICQLSGRIRRKEAARCSRKGSFLYSHLPFSRNLIFFRLPLRLSVANPALASFEGASWM